MALGKYTRPDNILMSSSLLPSLVHCMIVPEEPPARMDHMLILTVLHASPEIQPDATRPNYKAVDWEAVREELVVKLEDLDMQVELNIIDEFNQCLEGLSQAILEVIDTRIPKARPSPYQKCWWTKELAEKQKEVHKLTCRAYSR